MTEDSGIDLDTGEPLDDADAYVGQEVTVSGEVSARINDTTFHIGDDESGGLLVFSDTPVVDRLESNDVVQVTGIVREVRRETFETDFGIPWDDEYGGLRSRHAVVATSVEVIGEVEEEPLD